MILITLLGDDLSNLTPVIYEFQNQITHHILIHDDAVDDVRRAEQFHNGLRRLMHKNNLSFELSSFTLDEDSKNDIVNLYHTICANYKGEIVLHSTEGFASLSLILSNLVLSGGGKVITYDARDNELNTIHNTTMTRSKLSSKLNIKDYLSLLNFKILDIQKRGSLSNRKEQVMTLFKDHNRFLELRNALSKRDTHFNYRAYIDLLDILSSLGILDEDQRLIPSEKMTLEGGLFEEYVFWLCESMGFDDIALGVKIDFDQGNENNQQNRVMNEFDILMTHNNRIYTVECKMVRRLDGLEYIYKYDGLVDILGYGTKAVLLNVAKQEMESYQSTKISENFRPSAIRRARMNDIEVYHNTHINPIAFTNLIRNFFNLPQ
jgi:hypothetical protein